MFTIGLILVIVGLVFAMRLLLIIGAIILVIGLLGNGYAWVGPRPAGGRRRYWY